MADLDPTIEFWENVPPGVRRGIRELAFGEFSLVSIPEHAMEVHAVFLGQALALALVNSNARLAHYNPYDRLSPSELHEVRNFIREQMDICFRENTFPELRDYFAHALALNSAEPLHAQLNAEMHPRMVRRLEQMLSEFRGASGASPDSPREMSELGTYLRLIYEVGMLATVNYGLERGIFDSEAVEPLRGRLAAARDYYAQTVRAWDPHNRVAIPSERQVGEWIERARLIRRIVDTVQVLYGDVHPLMQGFDRELRNSRDEWEQARLEALVEEVERYLNRH